MKLSVVFAGRNDNYGGNFTERVSRAFARNMKEVDRHGLNGEIEWVWVEWNPPNEDYLAYALAPLGITCYVVSPAVHRQVICPKYADRLVYPEAFVVNTGLRRARGEWMVISNPDVVFGPKIWNFWARGEFDPNVLYRAERCDVGCQYFDQPFEAMQAHVVYRHMLQSVNLGNAAGDFMMLSSEHLMGLNESANAQGASVHLDSNFMRNWSYERESIGVVYKADHPLLYCRGKSPRVGNARWNQREEYTNSPDWGLVNYPSHELAAGITYIEAM